MFGIRAYTLLTGKFCFAKNTSKTDYSDTLKNEKHESKLHIMEYGFRQRNLQSAYNYINLVATVVMSNGQRPEKIFEMLDLCDVLAFYLSIKNMDMVTFVVVLCAPNDEGLHSETLTVTEHLNFFLRRGTRSWNKLLETDKPFH